MFFLVRAVNLSNQPGNRDMWRVTTGAIDDDENALGVLELAGVVLVYARGVDGPPKKVSNCHDAQ